VFPDVRELERQVPLLFGDQAVEIPGARRFLTSLENSNARWAVVTSGTRPLVEGWLKVLRLAEPKRLVTAEDVARGKPDPACYLMGREKLSIKSSTPCLVLEDAPAGIRAGKAAGCKVLALATTHSMEQLREAGADWIIPDLRSIQLTKVGRATGDLSVKITGAIRC
jgi:glycerol 3-phosphatase-1